MSNGKSKGRLMELFGSLGWPVLLGLAATVVFYALIFRGPLNVEFCRRYFASHPVTYFETSFFFVGLAALTFKLLDVLGQLRLASSGTLEELLSHEAAGGSRTGTIRDPARWLDKLAEMPERIRQSIVGRRLAGALEFIERKGSADGLEDELKYLADSDVARQHDSFSLVRIIIWATPMLGFLGTVIGITQALGDLDPKQLATDAESAMGLLLAGLYVAFDTTALALSLSMVLMFVQFFVERLEAQVLDDAEQRMNESLVGRFDTGPDVGDPHVAAIDRMARAVIASSEQLLQQQTELWQTTIDAAHDRWRNLVDQSEDTLQHALAASLDESLARHAEQLGETHRQSDERLANRWAEWQSTLAENGRLLHAQQSEMSRQAELMLKIVEATGEVNRLETSLNRNLESLAAAGYFEDAVNSLTAAISLLNARVGHGIGHGGATAGDNRVQLTDSHRDPDRREKDKQGRAA